jgi:minor extracellular serine protease Vpr
MDILYRFKRMAETRFWFLILVTGMLLSLNTVFAQTNPDHRQALRNVRASSALEISETRYSSDMMRKPSGFEKLDPALRFLVSGGFGLAKKMSAAGTDGGELPYAVTAAESGELFVEVFLQTQSGFDIGNLSALGARNIVTVGNIMTAVIPVDNIFTIASDERITYIETGTRRKPLNSAGRVDIGADKVHTGLDLPDQMRGEGVIVGVLDSGIDFSHPDFSDDNGTRIQFLLEYTQAGQSEWTKSQIDSDPVSVTQRDLDDGGGHGTHVAGSAAGGGRVNAQYQGVAPNSDIIFVKGLIGGGFSDNVVVGGCQYIFTKADVLGKPAVINLSLGSNFGPLDGTSLYEQALSDLTGAGKIIVAAAGNEGFDLIHAGSQLPASTRNVTIMLPDNPSQTFLNMWYDPGVVAQVAIGAFIVVDGELIYLGSTNFVPAGSFMNYTPFVIEYEENGEQNEDTLGIIGIDAQTIADPGNGDGNILVDIQGDPENGIDLTEVIWAVIYDSNTSGRFDMWTFGGEFWPSPIGGLGVNEIPGDTFSTVGTPASAQKVISVGSYVTTNTWTNIDNQTFQWQNPDPTRQTNNPVVPSIGQKSYFSSFGPTRDGRVAPDISAPGELIFSPLSSHLTEGQGYMRALVLQGGQYIGSQGTSMASPHVTGVVALMLQANPTLTYEDVLSILQETARTDTFTGTVPNNLFGAGKVDAHAAVKKALDVSGGPGSPSVLKYFDPQSEQKIWVLDNILPIDSGFVFGTNRYLDKAKGTVYTLPAGQTEAKVTQVNVWFGYKKTGLTDQTYRIQLYDGTSVTGPTGSPLASKQFLLRDISADDNLATNEGPTAHIFDESVTVGPTFFAVVDFGSYSAGDHGNAGIVSTDYTGTRVAEVWEQWDNDQWHNLSDAWLGSQAAPGSGTNGWHMWMEVVLEGTTSVPGEDLGIPATLALDQNYPNPFNPVTVIRYSLPQHSVVSLTVYDILGREVKKLVEGEVESGIHSVEFDGSYLSSGLYFYRLDTVEGSIVRKMLLLK